MEHDERHPEWPYTPDPTDQTPPPSTFRWIDQVDVRNRPVAEAVEVDLEAEVLDVVVADVVGECAAEGVTSGARISIKA